MERASSAVAGSTGPLAGKRVVLGVCGGISAYKAVEVVRQLTARGAEVRVIMTESATRFVGPLTFRELSYHPVAVDLFAEPRGELMQHLWLAETADLFLIVPATANTIAKLAHGLADNLLVTCALAVRAPRLLAPAMDTDMFLHPATQANLQRLREWGWHVVGPESGPLARGNVGPGRLADPARIVAEAEALLARAADLAGLTVMVTAGPTQEPLDPVRFLSNRSSGRMGYALAEAAAQRGARVILVSGPVALPPPPVAELVRVRTAQEMYEAVLERFPACQVVIKAAAVADYRPEVAHSEKLKKEEAGQSLTLRLVRNPDILAELGRRKQHQVLVGFAAETQTLLAHAAAKLEAKNADLIVANDVTQPGAGFEVETNQVHLLYRDGRRESLPLMSKSEVAHAILDRVRQLLPPRQG